MWCQSDVLKRNIFFTIFATKRVPFHNGREFMIGRGELDRVRVVTGWLNKDGAARSKRACINITFVIEGL